jgi:hypothetical protein
MTKCGSDPSADTTVHWFEDKVLGVPTRTIGSSAIVTQAQPL